MVYVGVGIVENELDCSEEVIFVRVVVFDNDIGFWRERFDDGLFFVVVRYV